LPKYAQDIISKFCAKVYENRQKSAKVWKSMQKSAKCAKICIFVQKDAKVCLSRQKCALAQVCRLLAKVLLPFSISFATL